MPHISVTGGAVPNTAGSWEIAEGEHVHVRSYVAGKDGSGQDLTCVVTHTEDAVDHAKVTIECDTPEGKRVMHFRFTEAPPGN